MSECAARSADQFLRHADRLSTNSGGLKLSRFSEKTDKTCGPTEPDTPSPSLRGPGGPNRKTWEKSELRPTNVSARRSKTAFILGLVTKRGRSRTAIYWPRVWPTRGETRNDLETSDARAMDADRFHCVGPRRCDLHLAHRRSQVEINLRCAAGDEAAFAR